ncbi:N2227 domain containing protein [Trichuris trichiura]|uniref:carnosine N-methyltransferase n=1 Tax=Trichuris trichiura TaxID=36087 RepID=A0A077Z607_TRITR|nr:N2227 domain containing protein [Trichuris trichiura]
MDAHDLAEDEEEAKHYVQAVSTFMQYYAHSMKTIKEKVKWYVALSERQRSLIPKYEEHLRSVSSCIAKNFHVLRSIIEGVSDMFENMVIDVPVKERLPQVPDFQIDKLPSVLRQLVRDWAAEGQSERDGSYKPVIMEAERLFPGPERSKIRVLVPGAGLGRLAWEFARRGFDCQGNEYSLLMLFCSNFVLNRCDTANAFVIHPWIHQWSNNMTYSDQVASVTFPDVNPASLNSGGRLSMTAGDFLEVYARQSNCWDLVTTVFFIDTANNIIDYFETIYRLLKPGGYWINMGPLLYHFADMPGEPSIELAYEEIVDVMQRVGFRLLYQKADIPTGYTQNVSSMLRYTYRCVYFVCAKPNDDEEES